MPNPRRQHQQISPLQPHPDPPLIPVLPHIEISRAREAVADFFVFVHVLGEEGADLVVVDGAHGVGGDFDFVAVEIASGGGEGV